MSLAVNSPSPASVPSSGGVSTSAGSTLKVDRTMIVVKNVEPWPISDDLQGFPVHLSICQESVAVGICDVVHEQLGALKAVVDVHEAER